MIRKAITIAMFSLVGWQAQAAETAPVVESFNCNYNAGQDRADLDKAVDYWKSQTEGDEGNDNYFAALFSPIRATTPYDIHWIGVSPNLNAWAATTQEFANSDSGKASQARFDKVLTCQTSMMLSETVYQGTPPEPEDTDAIAEGYGCVLHEGKTMANVRALEGAWATMAKDHGVKANVFRWTPMISNAEADLIYVIGHDDLNAFAATNSELANTREFLLHGAILGSVMDCRGGLYDVDILQTPAPAE